SHVPLCSRVGNMPLQKESPPRYLKSSSLNRPPSPAKRIVLTTQPSSTAKRLHFSRVGRRAGGRWALSNTTKTSTPPPLVPSKSLSHCVPAMAPPTPCSDYAKSN